MWKKCAETTWERGVVVKLIRKKSSCIRSIQIYRFKQTSLSEVYSMCCQRYKLQIVGFNVLTHVTETFGSHCNRGFATENTFSNITITKSPLTGASIFTTFLSPDPFPSSFIFRTALRGGFPLTQFKDPIKTELDRVF